MNRPTWLPGAALSLAVLAGLAACSRGASPARTKAAEAAAPEPAPAASLPTGESDDLRSDEAPGASQPSGSKKETEGPSLSEPPAPEAKPWGQEGEEPEERLRLEEEKFTQAIEPSTLSCSGALPRRNAICTLAERICELAPSQIPGREHQDCTKARASCEKAKRAYAGRCGE